MAPNMKESFERYPTWIVIITNLVNFSIYASGTYLLWQINPILAALFLIYLLYLEATIYKEGCACCYYYGKLCAFGRGKLAKLFLKKDNPKKFCEREIGFKEMAPQFLVSLIPLAAGIFLLLKGFDWLILGVTAWPLVIMFLGNPIIYGKLACLHCKQSQICCPACEFFMKRAKKGNQ